MARGEPHVYLLDLAAGTFADLAVDQRGVDVAVTVDGPDGRRLATSDSHFGARGAEPVPVIAEQSGRYRLEVRPSGLLERSGKYEVRLAALRPATSRDRALVAAERLFARPEALPADRPDEAIALYRHALALNRTLDHLGPALAVFESEDLQGDLAGALTTLGDTYSRKGEGRQGIEALERALAIQRRIGDTGGEARTLNDLGWAYILLHDWRHVREC